DLARGPVLTHDSYPTTLVPQRRAVRWLNVVSEYKRAPARRSAHGREAQDGIGADDGEAEVEEAPDPLDEVAPLVEEVRADDVVVGDEPAEGQQPVALHREKLGIRGRRRARHRVAQPIHPARG